MVHRPADSRLLANLLVHEKEYAKHLRSLLDSSHLSLASLSAYAAASPPPMSHVIIAVAGSLASADDALRRYAASVNDWRHHLEGLKELEEEVGNIVRDREIFVTRLIKASKYQKSSTNRDSLQRSTTSLQSNLSLSATSKLTQAHSELQACEAHLALKERELWERRTKTVREGLSVRCTGMMACGQAWTEIGKDVLELLEGMDGNAGIGMDTGLGTGGVNDLSNSNKPLPIPTHRPSSDLSSLAPSHDTPSHEENAIVVRFPSQHRHPNTNMDTNTDTNPQMNLSHTLQIPPAHSISEFAFPTSDVITPQHVLPRRITEEDLRGGNQGGDGSSAEEEFRPVHVIENPRFAPSPPASRSHEGPSLKKFSIRKVTRPPDVELDASPPVEKRERKPSAGLGFFGSLRGLFRKDLVDVGWEGEGSGGPVAAGKRWGGDKGWATRTDRNLKKMKISEKGNSSGNDKLARSGSLTPSVPPAGGRRLKKANSKRKAGPTGSGVIAAEARVPQGQDRSAGLQNEIGPEKEREGGREDVDRGWVSDGGQLVMRSHFGPRANSLSRNSSKGKNTVTESDRDGVSMTSAAGMQGRKAVGRRKRSSVDAHGTDRLHAENGGRARRAVSMDGHPPSTSSVPPLPQSTHLEKTVRSVTTDGGHTASGTRNGAAVFGNVRSAHVGEGSTSLMSIVEGVARQNRQGWAHYNENQANSGVAAAATGNGGAIAANSRMLVVKAPQPVSRDELDAVVAPRTRRPASPPASWSSPALVSAGAGETRTNGVGSPSVEPIKAPLRSALRNTSRTPSPLPPSSLQNLTGVQANGRGNKKDKGKWRRKEGGFEVHLEDTDDEASTSSYETGHETLQSDEGGETERETIRGEEKAWGTPSAVASTVRTIRPAVDVVDHSSVPNGNQNYPDLDLSTSAETPTAAASSPMSLPQRRKSVRVSLQPTFSSTPPAVEDDLTHRLWNGVGSSDVHGDSSWPSRSRVRYLPKEEDIWQDSSEEDEEYKRARRLLMPTLKKEKKIASHISGA